jgi:superfamily II DNA or RNA helicase
VTSDNYNEGDAVRTTMTLGDGWLRIHPYVPAELEKELRYWHRSMDLVKYKRVSKGEWCQVYKLDRRVNPRTGMLESTMLTMPGFAVRVRNLLSSLSIDFDVVDRRTPPPQPDMEAAMAHLRPYQMECVFTLLKSGGGVLSAYTGYGKTHVMAAICRAFPHIRLCERGTPVIAVAAPDKDIVAKNYEDLCEMMPDRDIGILMSGVKRQYSNDIQVATLDSLHLIEADSVGVLIADEVHAAASAARAEKLASFTKAVRWGVSATPTGRFDGGDLNTEGLFGPVAYTRTYAQGVLDGAIVPIQVYWVKCPPPAIDMNDYHSYRTREKKYEKGVYSNTGMLRLFARIFNGIPDSLQTLCIVRHIEQMDLLLSAVPGAAYVHGTTNEEELYNARRSNVRAVPRKTRKYVYDQLKSGALRKVISTWIYKQGVNFPELSVIINAGGGGSDIAARQIPGRESRAAGDKKVSYLIDFWHDWDTQPDPKQPGRTKTGPLLSDDKARRKAYTSLGFSQAFVEPDGIPFIQGCGEKDLPQKTC